MLRLAKAYLACAAAQLGKASLWPSLRGQRDWAQAEANTKKHLAHSLLEAQRLLGEVARSVDLEGEHALRGTPDVAALQRLDR